MCDKSLTNGLHRLLNEESREKVPRKEHEKREKMKKEKGDTGIKTERVRIKAHTNQSYDMVK
jgi:hypothetical protein